MANPLVGGESDNSGYRSATTLLGVLAGGHVDERGADHIIAVAGDKPAIARLDDLGRGVVQFRNCI